MDCEEAAALYVPVQAAPGRALTSLPTFPFGGEHEIHRSLGTGRRSKASPLSCIFHLVVCSATLGVFSCRDLLGMEGTELGCLPLSVPVLMGAAIPRFQVMGILVKKCFPSQRRWCLWEPLRSHPTSRQSLKNCTLRGHYRRTGIKELGAGHP